MESGLGWISMWAYEKKLQYPVNIKSNNLRMAKLLVTQYGGSNGEGLKKGQPIEQYSVSGEYIKTYPSAFSTISDIKKVMIEKAKTIFLYIIYSIKRILSTLSSCIFPFNGISL